MSALPPIVCLCGSTNSAWDQLAAVARHVTLAGNIVVGPAVKAASVAAEAKTKLDALHLRKIEMADYVIVVCPQRSLGESTKAEVAHAVALGKTIRYTTGVANGEGKLRFVANFDKVHS